MPRNPLGRIAQINALSLMLITPEFYRIRRLRSSKAAKIDHRPAPFAMAPKRMQLEGLDIRYATQRSATGPTVLLLSPLPQSIICYDDIWSKLTGQVDLIALDLPGFGQSRGGNDYMTFSAQSAFLEKFIKAMELRDVHIVAPDIAMPVALHYAIHRGENVKSLLVGDGPGLLPSSDGSLIRKIVGSGFWRTLVKLNGAKTFIAGAMKLGYLHYSPKQKEIEDYIASYAGRIGQVTEFFKYYPEGCQDLTENIQKLTVPVKVFWGDEDGFLNVENAYHLKTQLPNGSLHIFENCGHFCYQDKSSEFAQMIQKWVQSGV